jgi:hypothetical protein
LPMMMEDSILINRVLVTPTEPLRLSTDRSWRIIGRPAQSRQGCHHQTHMGSVEMITIAEKHPSEHSRRKYIEGAKRITLARDCQGQRSNRLRRDIMLYLNKQKMGEEKAYSVYSDKFRPA